jgi:hypothetical protein
MHTAGIICSIEERMVPASSIESRACEAQPTEAFRRSIHNHNPSRSPDRAYTK